MIDRVIELKDYQKVLDNITCSIYNREFQGCLFIYDEEFDRYIRKIRGMKGGNL